VFLQTNFVKPKKAVLGVAEPKLAAAITEALNVQCNHLGAVPEIIRGKCALCPFFF